MNDLVITQSVGKIECDFEAIKSHLDEQLELYRKMVFTEESKKDAKDTVAQLRKEKKDFQDRCKEVKNAYLVPLDEFMGKAGEVANMFDIPINFINEQIADFERQRVEAKQAEIKAVYDELVPEEEIREYIPLNKIYDSKWDNATTTMKSIKEAIMGFKEKVKTGLETLSNMQSEALPKGLDMFKTTLDLAQAMTVISNYENQKKEIMERERERVRQEEESRIRREEREKLIAEQKAAEEQARLVEEVRQETIDAFIPTDLEAPVKKYLYNITLSADAKEKLEMYMDSVGIEYDLC